MKTKTLLSTFLLFLFAVSTAWATIGGSGTLSDPYTINSTDDWDTFASNVGNGTTYQDKYVKLTADITVETMVGTSSNPFKGTFNGAGHTLTINYDVTENVCAPFRFIDGATIVSLRVGGRIYNFGKQSAGIVGYSYGNSKLISSLSEVRITSLYNGNASNAGLIASVQDGTVTINNCAFFGSLQKGASYNPINNGGLVGWTETNNNAKASISNSLFDPSRLTMDGEQTLARARNTTSSLTIDNCYYTKAFGAAQGTLTYATGEELVSLLGSGWEVEYGTAVPIMGDHMMEKRMNLTFATVSGIKNYYSYTGNTIAINYTVTALDGTTLTKGAHFTETISPATVKDKGDYTLTITGKGDYSGSLTFHFKVDDLTSATVSGIKDYYSYTGNTIAINYTVTALDGTRLTKGMHYTETISPATVKDMGDYTLTITGKSDYSGSQTFHFKVGPYIPDGLSVDNDYSYPEAGYYYVNMPSSGTTTLTFNEASITTFKIYDDGGKGGSVSSSGQPGNYSAKYSGYLIINAPTGYVIQLTGSISTESRGNYLRIRDGATSESPKLTRDLFSVVDYAADDIGVLLSSGKSVYLYFEGGTYTRAGFDLTAKLINMNDAYNVNMASADNGSIISDKPTAKVHETVSLTATPDNGYMLCDVEVKDATGHTINISGDLWQNGVLDVTFKMPASDVTVTPVFCTSGNLYVNMPVEGTISRTIPATETSVKVYDDGGIDGNYNYRANGYLQLAAPDGYLLKLSGGMKSSSRGLTVYDGNSTNASMLKNEIHGNIDDIGTVTTTGRYMLLFFNSIDHYDGEGLDLTVTLVDARPSRDVHITEVTGGSITANPTSAKAYETVELNISPSTNYLLKDLTVTDESNNAIEFSGGEWYTNSDVVTFTMPASAVTVTPTFTDNLTATDDGLSIAMPADGVINATIPSNVQSYKVKYNHKLTASVSSTLEMTAPEGYLLQLSATGSASMNSRADRVYFRVYDGAFEPVYGHKLIDDELQNSYHYTYNNTGVVSTGNKMTVYCWAIANYGMDLNLDLTVKLVSASTSNAVSVSNSITNGQVVSDKNTAEPNEIVTLTATPDAGYVLESISVTDENGTALLTPAATDATFGDVSYYAANNFTFKMRLSDATVTATFMPKTDFFVNMPKTGQRDFTIPDGTTSFKVYDNSGKNGYYTLNDNGKLLLTAPEGYVMHVSGYVKLYKSSNDGDYLDIYDGNSTSATNLRHLKNGARNAYYDDEGNYFDTPTTPVYVISSTNQILLHFVTDGSGYVSSYGGVYLTVTLKKSLTNSEISIAAIPDQTYTGSAICPVANVTDGETPLVLGTDYTVTCTNNISAGTAEMTVTGMGDYAGVDPITKSFKILPKEIAIAWDNQTSFVYNGAEQAPTATAEGLVNGDECSITVSGAKDVGLHTATATKLSNANYKLPTTGLEQNFEITKATLTVSAKNKTIAYGDEPANDGVEYTSFLGSDDASVLSGTLTYGYNYEKGNKTGEYVITPSGLTADNYEINFVSGTLTVESKKLLASGAAQVLQDQNGVRAVLDGEYQTDKEAVNISTDTKVNAVEFKRTFTKGKHSTIMLPFSINVNKVNGADFYQITDIEVKINDNGGKKDTIWGPVIITQVEGAIMANTPYLLGPTETSLSFDIGKEEGVTLNTSKMNPYTFTKEGVQWEFRGTYHYFDFGNDSTQLIKKSYGFAAADQANGLKVGQFRWTGTESFILPMRCYLVYKRLEDGENGNGDGEGEGQGDGNGNGDGNGGAKPQMVKAKAPSRSIYSSIPETLEVVIVDEKGGRTVIGTLNTRSGELRLKPRPKHTYDLKGRRVNATRKAKGVYVER